jgi:hypothetical protein
LFSTDFETALQLRGLPVRFRPAGLIMSLLRQ